MDIIFCLHMRGNIKLHPMDIQFQKPGKEQHDQKPSDSKILTLGTQEMGQGDLEKDIN